MKKYLVGMSILMACVLGVVVMAFVYVQVALAPQHETVSLSEVPDELMIPAESGQATTSHVSAEEDEMVAQPAATSPSLALPVEGIPLTSLRLNETQRSLLRQAGIEYETFVITPDMIRCARAAVGDNRYSEIIGGASPSTWEMVSLLQCL